MDDAIELQKLENYLQNNLGIGFEQIIGHSSVLKTDLPVIFPVNPKNYAYTIPYPINLKKGTTVKIADGPTIKRFQPLGNGNYLSIEIIDPQADLGKLSVEMKSLVEAIK